MRLRRPFLIAALGSLAGGGVVAAAQLVVVEARGGNLRPGMRIDANAVVDLKVGERVVLIAPDGRAITIRGAYRGPAAKSAGGDSRNASMALAALISTRRDRSSAVGAVRSGAGAADLPDPWLIDISRPGERCFREGTTINWWRPKAAGSQPFTIYPVDRSWKADFVWKDRVDTMQAPELGKLDATRNITVKLGDQEFTIRLNIIPRDLTDPVMVTSWMLQKACFQQADAMMRTLEQGAGAPATLPQGAPAAGLQTVRAKAPVPSAEASGASS